MRTTKVFALVIICLTYSSLSQARAEDTKPAAAFDGDLIEVQMLDAKNGWATGWTKQAVYLLRTEDGGGSWTDISPRLIQAKDPLNFFRAQAALTFRPIDAMHGWVSCLHNVEGALDTMDLFSTDDGGRHWHSHSFDSPSGSIRDIRFVDKEHGFIEAVFFTTKPDDSWKAIYRTIDGGQTWQMISNGSPEHPTEGALPTLGSMQGTVFRNDKDGWVGGMTEGDQRRFFFHTVDGGKTWQPQSFPTPQNVEADHEDYDTPVFSGARKMDGVTKVRFEKDGSDHNVVAFYGTHDGGAHWEKTGVLPAEQSETLNLNTAFVDADHGWMLVNDALFATTDRGATWAKVDDDLPFKNSPGSWTLQFLDPAHGWVLGRYLKSPDDEKCELLQTVDGGRTWKHRFGVTLGKEAQ